MWDSTDGKAGARMTSVPVQRDRVQVRKCEANVRAFYDVREIEISGDSLATNLD